MPPSLNDAHIHLTDHIKQLLGKEPANIDRVIGSGLVQDFKDGELILGIGNTVKQLWYIESGTVLVFFPVGERASQLLDILGPGEWGTDLQGFLQERPAQIQLRCLQEARVISFQRDVFQDLMHELPAFAEGFQQVISAKYMEMQQRTMVLTSLSAAERIDWLVREKPHWFRNIQDKWLANILGMSRETFCRLKP